MGKIKNPSERKIKLLPDRLNDTSKLNGLFLTVMGYFLSSSTYSIMSPG